MLDDLCPMFNMDGSKKTSIFQMFRFDQEDDILLLLRFEIGCHSLFVIVNTSRSEVGHGVVNSLKFIDLLHTSYHPDSSQ